MSLKQKLVYILPEYRENTATHLQHNYEFLLRANEDFDIFLFIEKGEKPKNIQTVYRAKFRFMPLRVIELFCFLAVARMRGYKTFWTHYSFFGAILAPFFGRSFYWNCGMTWLYKRGRIEEYFFRLALRRSILVTGTEGMKRQYISHYKLVADRVEVMPNWILLSRFTEWSKKRAEARVKLSIASDTRVVLFVHRLSKRKGADFIMPVAKEFIHNDKVLFLVVGSGPLEREIKGINIRAVGEVSGQDIAMYFAAADVFFMPSEEEGFPHVLLEAMAVGVPIVVSDVGGVREIMPPELQEYIVKQDKEKFKTLIEKLLGDQKRWEQISQIEQQWVTRYSIEEILNIFKEIVKEK